VSFIRQRINTKFPEFVFYVQIYYSKGPQFGASLSHFPTIALGSISSKFYVQLLHSQIPKALKDTNDLTVFFYPFGIYERKSCTY